ncbi:hypothetical protein HTZ77_14265 [Nonomuraea sp. SMC257]|uniref:Uncharacterized protein n=1 Tax=Nonomuraea montanisoli TaxID=2741721 RepID=A0A7Y6I7I6_9ACTN|nr:hypothetical protein [Nonomuraea montanisoli]NUW32588.1 hypothetical protein [Nonomuraea montanisoli]
MRLTTCGGAGFRIGPPETGRRGPTRGPAVLGALLTSACAAVACTAAPPPATPPSLAPPSLAPSSLAVPPPTRVADLVLPFDAYRPTPGQRALMARARAALLARCMHRRGHAVSPPRPDAAAYAAGDPGNSRRYGVADPEPARRNGYHLPPSRPSSQGRSWDVTLGRSARRALDGTPGRPGCDERATAEQARRTSPEADWQWLALQDARTVAETAGHPAVVEAVARWKTCMERAGHPYPSPEAAIADPRWDLRSAAVTAREKRTATADTACKWSSGLVPAWFAADAAAQRAVIAAEPGRFADLRDDLRARLDRAAEVLER